MSTAEDTPKSSEEQFVLVAPIKEDSHYYNNGEVGDCFPVALSVALAFITEPSYEAKICHGSVVSNDGRELHGQRVVHAWVEFFYGGHYWVADASRPEYETLIALREVYYKHIAAELEQVRRYSILNAYHATQYLGHCGPWERPLVEVADEELEASKYLPSDWVWLH